MKKTLLVLTLATSLVSGVALAADNMPNGKSNANAIAGVSEKQIQNIHNAARILAQHRVTAFVFNNREDAKAFADSLGGEDNTQIIEVTNGDFHVSPKKQKLTVQDIQRAAQALLKYNVVAFDFDNSTDAQKAAKALGLSKASVDEISSDNTHVSAKAIED